MKIIAAILAALFAAFAGVSVLGGGEPPEDGTASEAPSDDGPGARGCDLYPGYDHDVETWGWHRDEIHPDLTKHVPDWGNGATVCGWDDYGDYTAFAWTLSGQKALDEVLWALDARGWQMGADDVTETNGAWYVKATHPDSTESCALYLDVTVDKQGPWLTVGSMSFGLQGTQVVSDCM